MSDACICGHEPSRHSVVFSPDAPRKYWACEERGCACEKYCELSPLATMPDQCRIATATMPAQRSGTDGTLGDDLRDCLAEMATVEDQLAEARGESDELAKDVLVLRTVVSAQLHGDWQAKANAYAALRAHDALKAGAK